jgi:O-methyltransferase
MSKMRFYIDRLNSISADGWVFSPYGSDVRVEALLEGEPIGEAAADIERPDVGSAFDHAGNSARAGFHIDFSEPVRVKALTNSVGFRFKALGVNGAALDVAETSEAFFNMANIPPCDQRSPFPRGITNLLVALWPETFASADFADEGVQHAAVDQLELLRSRSDAGASKELVGYFRFLNACWAHFCFVERSFPEFNPQRKTTDKDWCIKANSPREMIAISNHLLCLKSYGVTGALVEFGAYKGYSSSMLSYACSLLRIPMLIFDSFEGLPQSGSDYYKEGEFAGALEEVRRNIALYGSIENVTFHQGYFVDVLPRLELPPLLCLWMDVDLESSARDVMRVLPRLDPQAALFSHECSQANFGETISAPRSPTDVIPPILDAYKALGWKVRGRFLYGYTGAFWREDSGIPVLAHDVLFRLIKLAA